MKPSSTIDPDQVFSLLSVKDGMNDPRYFVGREEQHSSVNCCVIGDQRSSVWLHGPKRIGKSSMAKALMRKAKENETIVFCVDAIDLFENGFKSVLRRAIKQARSSIKIKGKTTKMQFESLAANSKAYPILLVFDEFDKVALTMQTDEQAFLRRLSTDHAQLSYLFISSTPPQNIVEEIPDVNSRLLGICNQQRLMPLERKDIITLCKKVGEDLDIPDFVSMSDLIRKAVGGLPVAVMTMVKALAVTMFHREKLDMEDIRDEMQKASMGLEADLQGYWFTLNSETRSVLSGECEVVEYKRKVKEDGFFNRVEGLIIPDFLIAAGKRAGSFPPTIVEDKKATLGQVDRLFKGISELNTSLQLRGLKNGIYIGNQTIDFWKLSRYPCTETELKEALDYLYKVFYEGAREQGGKRNYRLPSPLDDDYRKHRVVGAISNLRNFYDHDKSRPTDSEKPNKYFKEASEIFEMYCGRREPTTDEHRQKVRDGLIRDLVELLRTIYDKIHGDIELIGNQSQI